MNDASENARTLVSMPGQGRAESVMRETHVYRFEEQQTQGSMITVELEVPPGHGLPPHTHHREDETFYVVAGAIEFTGEDLPAPVTVPQGGMFYGPRGRQHSFFNKTDAPGRLVVFTTPGANMQRMFGALADLTERADGAPSREQVYDLCIQYDIVFARPEAATVVPKGSS